ncbi:MAG: hypothetical protein ABR986_01620 [Methanomassiliicoccales archaeon]
MDRRKRQAVGNGRPVAESITKRHAPLFPGTRKSPKGEQLAPAGPHRQRSKNKQKQCGQTNSHRRGTTMGRYPFVCAYRRYLKNARARLGDSTIEERERKPHFMASIVQRLNERGKISSPNPTSFTEDDIIEIFLALKNRRTNGRQPKCSTLRKQMQLLKDVCVECENRKVEDLLKDGRIRIGNDHKEPFSLDREELKTILSACKEVGGWKGEVCRFATAMLTFLRLRPGELQKALVRDMDVRKWTYLITNPKGKGIYGEVRRLPVPDVLKPFVTEYLQVREDMLKTKGIKCAEPLITDCIMQGREPLHPAGVRSAEEGSGAAVRNPVQMERLPAHRRADRPGPGRTDRSGVAFDEARIDANDGAVLLPHPGGLCVHARQ